MYERLTRDRFFGDHLVSAARTLSSPLAIDFCQMRPSETLYCIRGRSREEDLALMNDRHVVHSSITSSTKWVERITIHVLADVGKQAVKTVALAGIESGGGIVQISSCGFPDSACAIPKRCRMPPKIMFNAFFAVSTDSYVAAGPPQPPCACLSRRFP